MKGKFIICDEFKLALLLVQMTPTAGVIGGYNQILQNALICAFFTICTKFKSDILEFDIGYDGWIPNSPYEDFGNSKLLKNYLSANPDEWFCKIINEQL